MSEYQALINEGRRFVLTDRDSREGVVMLVRWLTNALEASAAETAAARRDTLTEALTHTVPVTSAVGIYMRAVPDMWLLKMVE